MYNASNGFTVKETLQYNLVKLLLHSSNCFPSHRVFTLYVAILQVHLQIFIEVQDRFVRDGNHEVLKDHPSDLTLREKEF